MGVASAHHLKTSLDYIKADLHLLSIISSDNTSTILTKLFSFFEDHLNKNMKSSLIFCIFLSLVILSESIPHDRKIDFKVPRPKLCKSDNEVYRLCYLCARAMEDLEVYNGCCAGEKVYYEFCQVYLA